MEIEENVLLPTPTNSSFLDSLNCVSVLSLLILDYEKGGINSTQNETIPNQIHDMFGWTEQNMDFIYN